MSRLLLVALLAFAGSVLSAQAPFGIRLIPGVGTGSPPPPGEVGCGSGTETGTADLLSSSWENATGSTDAALLDGTAGVKWDAWGGSLASVIADGTAPYGSNSLEAQHPSNAAYNPNGPAFRVGQDVGFTGLPITSGNEVWFAWCAKHSSNWEWGNNEHKMLILKDGGSQSIYYNINAYGVQGNPGHIRLANQLTSLNHDGSTCPTVKTDGTWQKFELYVLVGSGTSGQMRAWVDEVECSFSPAASATNTGTSLDGFVVDGTYNDYPYVVSLALANPGMLRYTDGFRVGTVSRVAD